MDCEKPIVADHDQLVSTYGTREKPRRLLTGLAPLGSDALKAMNGEPAVLVDPGNPGIVQVID